MVQYQVQIMVAAGDPSMAVRAADEAINLLYYTDSVTLSGKDRPSGFLRIVEVQDGKSLPNVTP